MIGSINEQSSGSVQEMATRRASMFQKWDADKSGSLTSSEIEGLLGDISEKTGKSFSLEDFVAALDKDSNGSINEEEAKSIRTILGPPPNPPDGTGGAGGPKGPTPSDEELFSLLDKDESEGISESELKDLLSDINEKSGKDTDIATVLKQLDTDGDGVLNSEELKGLKEILGPPPKPISGFEMRNGLHPEDAVDRYSTSGLLDDDTQTTSSLEI